jgi:hypothetical protein
VCDRADAIDRGALPVTENRLFAFALLPDVMCAPAVTEKL